MVLCKPFPAPEPDKKDESKRKVCERDGIVYENKYFRVTTPESWNVLNRLKGALTKDKYRIIASSPAGGTELVIAHSDNYDEMVDDWKQVTQRLLPVIEADESKLQTLPDLVMELKSGGGGSSGASAPTEQRTMSRSNILSDARGSQSGAAGGGGHRRASKSALLQMQRDIFEEKMAVLQEQRGIDTIQARQLENYDIYRTIGTGSFGRVLLCKHKSTGRYCAMKIIRKEIVIKLKQVEHTLNERNILACINCPFIIHMLEYFQDRRSLYFISEYVNGGELFTHIHRNRYFSFEVARFFAAETVLAFEYLHNLDIIYRDLKPENMLIDFRGHLRITDFGFAKRVTDRTWTLCGTPEYLAPEIILSKGYAHAVDWWALGILIYEMRSGHAPFYDPSQMEMYKKIVEGKLQFPAHFKPEERMLISAFLTSDLTKRLGNLKNGVQEIKSHPYFKGVMWDALYNMDVPSPYIPKTSGEGDDSNFDRYDEEKIMWAGENFTDPYEEIFKNF